MSQDINPKQEQSAGEDSPEVEQELSQVATNPKQSMLILVVISAIFLYLFFNLFISGEDSDKKIEDTPIPTNVSKPVQIDTESDVPSIPTLPSPPKLEDPTPPPPPVTEPLPVASEEVLPELPSKLSFPTDNTSSNKALPPSLPFSKVQDDGSRKRMEAKRKSAIILVAGVPATKTSDQLQEEVDFKYRGDMNLVLGRGKMLDAIIETAINTDIGGEIRAIISRDIYSEWGKNILLPKGSRVFGSYAMGIEKGGYGRISIEWTRIDLTNGYSLNLSGSGVDSLGRKGNQGRLDNKFKERFSNAVLRSAFNITLANAIDSTVKPKATSQAAANQNQVSTNIKNIANGIFTQSNLNDSTKRVNICAHTLAAITDKTSTVFTQINTACVNLAADATATDTAKLVSLMSNINETSDKLIKNTTANIEETKAQLASKQAFTDITDTVKNLLEEQEFKPTITIDQGTPVKIYVNKDYKFPKVAVNKSRSLK
tara:strand:+ start:2073 stop:3527 length:1455 start_codon:yes stop_codon:yes gene_type:complete